MLRRLLSPPGAVEGRAGRAQLTQISNVSLQKTWAYLPLNLPSAVGAFLIRPSTSTLLAGSGRPGRVPPSVISLVRWHLVRPVVRRTRLANRCSLLALVDLRRLVHPMVHRGRLMIRRPLLDLVERRRLIHPMIRWSRLTDRRSLLALVELRRLVHPTIRRSRLTNRRCLLALVELRRLVHPMVHRGRLMNRRPLLDLVERRRLVHPTIRGSGPMWIVLPDGSLLKIPGVGSIRWAVVVLMVRAVVRIPVDVPVMIAS